MLFGPACSNSTSASALSRLHLLPLPPALVLRPSALAPPLPGFGFCFYRRQRQRQVLYVFPFFSVFSLLASWLCFSNFFRFRFGPAFAFTEKTVGAHKQQQPEGGIAVEIIYLSQLSFHAAACLGNFPTWLIISYIRGYVMSPWPLPLGPTPVRIAKELQIIQSLLADAPKRDNIFLALALALA